MGRSVQIDGGIERYAHSCAQSRVAAEVGTLVGRCAPGKDLVLQALRAPERDGVAPLTVTAAGPTGGGSKKGGKGGKPQPAAGGGLQLDDEWVVDHAVMLERLLPGGLGVVGFYVLCPTAAFAGAATLLAALAGQAAKELGGGLPSLLVLHIDAVTGALSLREAGGAGGASLRPCELKPAGGLLDQMVQLQSRYALDLELPVTSSKQELQAAFQAVTDAGAQRLRGALGLLGGQLATDDCQLADLAGSTSASASGAIPLELLLLPSSSQAFCTAGNGKAGSGLQRGRAEGSSLGAAGLHGVLDCRACVHRREPATAAVDAIRADVRRSLQARLDALLDAAEQQHEAAAAEHQQAQQTQAASSSGAAAPAPPVHPLFATAGSSGSKPLAVPLPRRAFVVTAAAGGVPYCDYLFEGESAQAMLGRLQMLLPMPGLGTAAVECLEQAAAPGLGAPGGSKPHARGSGAGCQRSRAASGALSCTMLAAGSAAAAALALAVGYLSLGGGQ